MTTGTLTDGDRMALNIKNAETEQLARELARRRGTGIREAVTHALRKEVERERNRPRARDKQELLRQIDKIVQRFNARPLLDDRSNDEIVGYNEQGHFDSW
jgi:antitoxin VapB